MAGDKVGGLGTMKANLDECLDILEEPYEWVKRWKEKTKKRVVGCVPMHIPEEMIHASGMLPIVIMKSNKPITLGHDHIPNFFCAIVRSTVDMAVRGQLSFLDGLVYPDICTPSRQMVSLMQWQLPEVMHMPLSPPATLESIAARSYWIEKLHSFKEALQTLAGEEITWRSIQTSIDLYNRNRALLRRLYEIRRAKLGLLKARETLALVVGSMLMPRERYNRVLEEVLAELEKREPIPSKGVRLVISGSLCEVPPVALMDMIEDLGGIIVDDDLYTGFRYIAADTKIDADPIESLADRYVNMFPPCPTRVQFKKQWGDHLVNVVKRSQAQGVVMLLVKYCEPHEMYYPDLKSRLSDAGIPHLLLETEHELIDMGATRTKLEAFIELVRGV